MLLKNLLAAYAEDQDNFGKTHDNFNLVANALSDTERCAFKRQLRNALKNDEVESPQGVINNITATHANQASDAVHSRATFKTCLFAVYALLALTGLIMSILVLVGTLGAESLFVSTFFMIASVLSMIISAYKVDDFVKAHKIKDMQTAQVSQKPLCEVEMCKVDLTKVNLTAADELQDRYAVHYDPESSGDEDLGRSLGLVGKA